MKAPAMRGHLQRCWLFTWRTPEAAARPFLPAPFELVTLGGFAFWNVVVCELRDVRPSGLPAYLGIGYRHVAYRLHARVRLATGESVEGIYFVRSDCDRRIVAAAGNHLTDFRFHTARIDIAEASGSVKAEGANAAFRLRDEPPASLAAGSPFASPAEAAAFLKYKPCALSHAGANTASLVRVARAESDWKARLVTVEESAWDFFKGLDVVPEVCTALAPVDYEWKRAETHRLAA